MNRKMALIVLLLLVFGVSLLVGCGAQDVATQTKKTPAPSSKATAPTPQSVIGGYYPSDSSSEDEIIIDSNADSSFPLYIQSIILGEGWESPAALSGDQIIIKDKDHLDSSGRQTTGTPPRIQVRGNKLIINDGQLILVKRGSEYTETNSGVTPENVVVAYLDAAISGRIQDALQYVADETYPKPRGASGSKTKAEWAEELKAYQQLASYTINDHAERGLKPTSQGGDEYKYYDVDFTANWKDGSNNDYWETMVSKNNGPWLLIEEH